MAQIPPVPAVPSLLATPVAAALTPSNDSRPPRNRRRPNAREERRNTQTPSNSTQPIIAPVTANSRLHGDASTFVPASIPPAANQARSKRNHKPKQLQTGAGNPVAANTPSTTVRTSAGPSRRRGSLLRSTAPDIATRIHEDIAKNIYECAICTNEVNRNSKLWSCRTCWTVFHISCIKKWSRNDGSAGSQGQDRDGQLPSLKRWRCPGCNLPQESLPSAYNCWCEKELDPKAIPGIPPHSCGQTCGRQKPFPKSCPHPCDLICHAGPCPPCTHIGPVQSCFCAKEAASRRCLDTNYDSGWSCGQICGDMMPCGKHYCPRPCHEGLCGACEDVVDAKCYCGKVSKSMKCDELDQEKESYDWIGEFDCEQVCDRMMDCGKHQCEKACHPQDHGVQHCPRSPDVVDHCPCGKTRLSELSEQPRSSCTDLIPNCKKACGKRLVCGHDCGQICHAGKCLPCLKTVLIKCRCGRNEFKTICHQGVEEPPQCLRVCKVNLNCGRHECGERCCTGERKATDRHNLRRKLKTITLDTVRQFTDEIEPEHICTRMCGRSLKCGNHKCENLCHKGPCESCKEAIFEDLSCNCGRTILQAPLPCGTKQPPCVYPCNQPKTCGHPQTGHSCHTDDESCPKCPFLTDKPCMCGKKTLKNQPCWRSEVSCGLVCGKKLKCGSHDCQRACHRADECEDELTPCQQRCGKAKKSCGHPCEKSCHAPSACKEDRACPFKVIITCDCQRRKEEVKCNARAGAGDSTGRQNALKCDDECSRLERNRHLAAALHISDSHADDHVPYSTITLKMYLEDVKWAHAQEELLRAFAADPNEKRLRFKPMKSYQRTFIHSVAEDFGFDGESMDPEPHRHVILFKTPKFVAAPMKTLQQAARIRRGALNIGAPVHSIPSVAMSVGGPTSKPDQSVYHWNGVLLMGPRFALTEGELQQHLIRIAPNTVFHVHFLVTADQLVLIPSSSSTWEDRQQVSDLLESLELKLAAELKKHGLAKEAKLGVFEISSTRDPRLTHRKGESISTSSKANEGGWSQVAAKGSAPVRAPQIQPVGQKPVYTLLGSRLAEAKKKRKDLEKEKENVRRQAEIEVVDDWEAEVEKNESAENTEKAVKEEEADEGHEDGYSTEEVVERPYLGGE